MSIELENLDLENCTTGSSRLSSNLDCSTTQEDQTILLGTRKKSSTVPKPLLKASAKAGLRAYLEKGISFKIPNPFAQPDSLDERYEELKVKRLADYPNGYPQYAAFVNSDNEFRIYRRFGDLRNRIILQRQFELAKLEKRLDEIDESDNTPSRSHRLASIEWDQDAEDSSRQNLIEVIDKKLEQYDTLLARERASLAMNTPTPHNHRNLINYVWNKRNIAKHEIDLLNRIDDFVILCEQQNTYLHYFMEVFLLKICPRKLQGLFSSEAQKEKLRGSEEDCISLFSEAAKDAITRFFITLLTTVLLMAPIFFLFKLNSDDDVKVAFVFLFILIFTLATSVFANPRLHELFAVTAAYAAVLVVFLTNFPESAERRES